ncbi:MAG: hypothetical protein ACLP0J_23080 [Solirubrobacteraceae bacterium]
MVEALDAEAELASFDHLVKVRTDGHRAPLAAAHTLRGRTTNDAFHELSSLTLAELGPVPVAAALRSCARRQCAGQVNSEEATDARREPIGTALRERRIFDWFKRYIGFGREDDV